jgi:hypothetical protein
MDKVQKYNSFNILRVLEKRTLMRTFGPKEEEVVGELRRMHNEELCNFHSSPNIVTMTKSRRMRQAGHVAHTDVKNVYIILVRKPEGKRPLGRPIHNGEMILEWILGKYVQRVWTGLL